MADLDPRARAALGYWGVIEQAAREGHTTAELWNNIRTVAESYGYERPGVSAAGVSILRGLAGGIQARGAQFAQLTDGRRVYSTLWADAPWSRPLGEQRANPMFSVRFQHSYRQGEELLTEWRTVSQIGRPPRTAGEIRAFVESQALNMARKYNMEHEGTDELQLFRI